MIEKEQKSVSIVVSVDLGDKYCKMVEEGLVEIVEVVEKVLQGHQLESILG